MRVSSAFTMVAAVVAFIGNMPFTLAQDAACATILNDYDPLRSGKNQRCLTDIQFNQQLVHAGGSPDYDSLMASVCSAVPCSHSTLQAATSKYVATCNASILAETANGNLLQVSKNLLEIYYAEPIRTIYCALDPNAKPLPAPAVTPPAYCLSNPVSTGTNRFSTNLAIYLTSGSIRATQAPFFLNGLDSLDVCSDCSKIAMNATIEYLRDNLMPAVGTFYRNEFLAYWTKLVPAYNTLCKTTFSQSWPEGTPTVTASTSPSPASSATSSDASLPTASSSSPTASGGQHGSATTDVQTPSRAASVALAVVAVIVMAAAGLV